jgi:hypothetical protein
LDIILIFGIFGKLLESFFFLIFERLENNGKIRENLKNLKNL